jgi:RNA polymerase primary sigma factor
VPVHVHEKIQRMESMVRTFQRAAGREPTRAELAERMEMPSEKLEALMRAGLRPLSIDDIPIDDMVAIDAREGLFPPDPADIVQAAELRAAVKGMLSSLPNKDEQIIRLRFGIGVDAPLTLEELGQRYAVTRERIRQIESKAIQKLRHPSRAHVFASRALGLKPPSTPAQPEAQTVDDAVDKETAERITRELELRENATSGPVISPVAPKASRLDRILAQAAELGIRVDDERSNSSGRIWVNLLDTPEKTHRRLARRLLELGFEFWPGKGYWR